MSYQFTSESVSEGHPDKVADAISDAIATFIINGNLKNRAAIETLVTTDTVVIAGEYKSSKKPTTKQIEKIVRDTVKTIGYEQEGFHWETVKITNKLHGQSADIALGTDDFGAGDQGLMFGYACLETPTYMPSAIYYSHKILQFLANAPIDDETEYLINPTGRFIIGGPDGDTGVTGRKIIVDTYGGYAPHGGGAFSGKDCTKVDRSAAYMARYLAKNLVAASKVTNCTVQLSYAIGVKEPTSVYVYGDGEVRNDLAEMLKQHVDLTPLGIINKFDLFNLDLTETTNYGHFGKEELPWERLDLFDE
jgi:S-adenosylmethionine synthetase